MTTSENLRWLLLLLLLAPLSVIKIPDRTSSAVPPASLKLDPERLGINGIGLGVQEYEIGLKHRYVKEESSWRIYGGTHKMTGREIPMLAGRFDLLGYPTVLRGTSLRYYDLDRPELDSWDGLKESGFLGIPRETEVWDMPGISIRTYDKFGLSVVSQNGIDKEFYLFRPGADGSVIRMTHSQFLENPPDRLVNYVLIHNILGTEKLLTEFEAFRNPKPPYLNYDSLGCFEGQPQDTKKIFHPQKDFAPRLGTRYPLWTAHLQLLQIT